MYSFVHKATTFRIFPLRIRHHVTTTDVLCTGDCQFDLLCVILDIYRSPAYMYRGQELVSVILRRCGTYICIVFKVLQFPVPHFQRPHSRDI